MFVIIADQIGSSEDADRVAGALVDLTERFTDGYPLAPERTAGDELQAISADASVALETALHLLRSPHWRVGLGIGAVRTPLPASVREASGPAFASARAGIEQAARRPSRFAAVGAGGAGVRTEQLGALIDLLLAHRARWSPAGWQLHDLLESGSSQAEAAERLGVTPQAMSKRARAAGLRIDAEARRALAALLADLGATVEASTPEGALA
ncbi:DNA-binding protein [Microcella sp.]|uniref:DNA-binding protein n=1 Tax=Microcella sp. TaxID=1913979 RepID=UPI00391D42B3